MCRSIKRLRNADRPATEDEVRAAALQFVRKISGYRAPSQKNQEAFDSAVESIAASSMDLLARLDGRVAAVNPCSTTSKTPA